MNLEQTLIEVSDGLLMPSESDFPFDFFCWEGQAQAELNPQRVLELTSHPVGSPVETVSLDSLLGNLAQEKDWHDQTQQENVTKFKTLVKTLNENLFDIEVYRVGAITIDVYIIGKTQEGDLAGLSTKVVET